ncbi:MAG TPA: cytochrome c3 family protein [Syntrophorhabdaceae bacterium]|mgnify:CR=1 FL=1|nr:cytochrome c3 family protein [Syntrophorhabdaceae bacterium]
MIEKNIKRMLIFFVSIFLSINFVNAASASPLQKALKKPIKAAPGNCGNCHKKEKVLPDGHVSTNEMVLRDCGECHKRSENTGLQTKLTASHFHTLSEINCEACHGKTKKRKPVEFNKCIKCHNPDKLVEITAQVQPENPHTSPHYGKELDCNLCHHQHKKSENFCNQCHKYNFIVP